MKKSVTILAAVALLLSLLLSSALAEGYVEVLATVNLRLGPGLNYKTSGTVHKGDTLAFTDKTSVDDRGVVWYRVETQEDPDFYYWVSSKYCELHGQVFIYAADGNTYLRKTPSLNGRVLDTLHQNERAEYLGKTEMDDRDVAWYKVEFEGQVGWVSSRYTTMGEERMYDREVIADDGQSYIRTQPNLNGEKLCVFRQDESAVYLEKSAKDSRGVTWYKVEYNGTIGWVSSRYASIY